MPYVAAPGTSFSSFRCLKWICLREVPAFIHNMLVRGSAESGETKVFVQGACVSEQSVHEVSFEIILVSAWYRVVD